VSTWLKLNKLSLNIKKTKAMVFHTPQRRVYLPNLKIDNQPIEYVNEFNYLGIHFDKNLTWNSHIDVIRQKLSRISGIFNKLKHFLPQATLLTLYNTLALPHLNYGVLAWGSKAEKLEKLQKKLVRNISNSKYNAHSEPILKKLSLLKATHICALHELKFCYLLEHGLLPYYFRNHMFKKFSDIHRHNTRHSNRYQLPLIKHAFMKTGLHYRVSETYNKTATIITSKIHTHSLYGFKKYIKRFFINSYDSECHVRNCYICNSAT